MREGREGKRAGEYDISICVQEKQSRANIEQRFIRIHANTRDLSLMPDSRSGSKAA